MDPITGLYPLGSKIMMEKIVKFPTHKFKNNCTKTSVSDPYVFCADPNTDLDPAQNLNPDPDPAHRKM